MRPPRLFFTLSAEQVTCTHEKSNVAYVVLGKLNHTGVSLWGRSWLESVYMFPMLAAHADRVETVAYVQTNKYVLVTSHGVYTDSTHTSLSFSPFLQPFQAFVWLSLIASSFAVAL